MDFPGNNNLEVILLAAGSGCRLKSKIEREPKCLLDVGGKSLLYRHLNALAYCGISNVHIVVGYRSRLVRQHLRHYNGPLSINFIENKDYLQGSIQSLKRGLLSFSHDPDLLIMDADVLYPVSLLSRLVEAQFSCGFLLDPRTSPKGEEMMLGVRDGLVHSINRELDDQWDLVGEGVGFFIIKGSYINHLKHSIKKTLSASGSGADYEMAIDHFLTERPAGYLSVADLPWTEIDFEQDLDFAKNIILPKILSLTTEPPYCVENHERPRRS